MMLTDYISYTDAIFYTLLVFAVWKVLQFVWHLGVVYFLKWRIKSINRPVSKIDAEVRNKKDDNDSV